MASVQGYSQLQARLHAMGSQGSGGILKRIGLEVVREAKLTVPRKTGNLGRSIRLGTVTATSATVIAGASYAADVEFGTRAHEITPKAKMALSFASQGLVNERFGPQRSIFRLSGSVTASATRRFGNAAYIVVRKVHHPGTRAQPYLLPAAVSAVKKVGGEAIVKAWNDAA